MADGEPAERAETDGRRARYSLQDAFLDAARSERPQVTVHLTNGVRLEGVIEDADDFTLLLGGRHGLQTVYKSAVAAVSARGDLKVSGPDWIQNVGAGARPPPKASRRPAERAAAVVVEKRRPRKIIR